MNWTRKDLLGLKDVSAEEIQYILDNAATMKHILSQNVKKVPHLRGKSVITLFYENSTRTRMSFELAGKYLSADTANITASGSSVAKGENLLDTGRTLDVMGCDVIVMRHNCSGAPHLLSQHVNASVINAGDGMNEHPTQALLDMFTMVEKKGSLKGLKVAILGDVLHSRVARSNFYGLNTMGAKVYVASPATLLPKNVEDLGVTVCKTVEEAIKDADVVMNLRMQLERQKSGLFPSVSEYAKYYGLNEDKLKLAKPDALIMHPGPVNRGVEITTGIADHERSVIDEQVTNGVAIRMALLYIFANRRNEE